MSKRPPNVRIAVSFRPHFVKSLDAEAEICHLSRSQMVAALTKEALRRRRKLQRELERRSS